jgi:predicted  nucleic acid-binding Zn-ribbon protein
MALQWSDIENGKNLLDEYERRSAQYEKDLAAFKEAGQQNDAEKARLQQEFAELQQLYERLSAARRGIAEKRDAVAS